MKNLISNNIIGILTLTILLLSVGILNADNKSINGIKANYTGQTVSCGEWINAANWDQEDAPDPTSYKCYLSFFHDIDYNPTGAEPWLNPFEWGNNIELTIKSGVIVTMNSDLDIWNNFTITIEPGGQFIVNGNVSINNNVVGIIDGEMYITGDLTVNGGGHSSITGEGDIVVDGTITDDNGAISSDLTDEIHRWLIVNNGTWDINTTWSKTQGGSTAVSPPNNQCIVHIENSYTGILNTTTEVSQLDIHTGGTLYIQPSMTLTVTDNVTTDGNLIIESDENGTGGLIYNGSASVNATCERYISANEFHYVSSPMTAAPVSSYNVTSGGSTNPNFYYFDETEINADWMYAWRQSTSGNLTPGLGYALYTNENYAYSLQGGTLNNQDFNFEITNTSTAGGSKSWNLIGNPFPCNIDGDVFIDANDNSTVFTGALYFWDDDQSIGGDYNSSDYIVYTKGGGTSGGNGTIHNGIIAPLQAFFVQANSGGNLTFTTSAKTSSTGTFLKGTNNISETDLQIFRLSIQNTEGVYNDILIKFAKDAEEDTDIYDGLKLKGNNFLAFYSIYKDENYAIQGFPLLTENRSIQLGIDANLESEYLIKAEDFINIDKNVSVFLEDTYIKKFIDLRKEDHSFNLSETDNNRFVLHFEIENSNPNPNTSNEHNEYVNELNIFNVNNILYIHNLDEECKIDVFDTSGKIVFNEYLYTGSNKVNLNLSNGFYIVRISGQNNKFVKKIIVN